MPGMILRKCCCCRCGLPAGLHARATITGWTRGCCPMFGGIQSQKPDAVLYGTWDLTPVVGTFTHPCISRFQFGSWAWTQSGNGFCGGSIGTTTYTPVVTLELADPTITGTGAWEWQLTQGISTGQGEVFRGNLPYTPGDCSGDTMNFTNNGYHSAGVLLTGCGSGGAGTVEFV
jgi:hypothetical protein